MFVSSIKYSLLSHITALGNRLVRAYASVASGWSVSVAGGEWGSCVFASSQLKPR